MTRNERIKILFVISSLVTGGAERVASQLMKYMHRDRFEIKLCLFEKKGSLLRELPHDIEVCDLKKKNRWSFPLLSLRLQKLIEDYKPEIVFTFLWYSTAVVSIRNLIFRNTRPPFFVAYEPHNHKQDIQHDKFKIIKSILINYAHNAADVVIVDSYGAANDISQNYKLNPQSIKVIYNSVDICAIQKQMRESVHLPFTHPGVPVITGFGRMVKRKGFDHLIRAFSLVRKQTQCKLMLIGQGEEKVNLEKLAKSLRIKEDVIFLGYQDNPYKFLSNSDVFVLSSLWEGFGNVIIEAMACGVPVISTRCPSGPDEIITDGINGLLIPVGDANAIAETILKLLKDEPLRKRLAEAGRKPAEDFKVEKMVAEYERVFKQIFSLE